MTVIWGIPYKKICPLSFFILDCDGVLTDGTIPRRFSVYDGMGIKKLLSLDFKVMFISGADSQDIQQRARQLEIDGCFLGIENKLTVMKQLMDTYELSRDQIAYMGDDINDSECMDFAGFSAAPRNAIKEIKKKSDYVTKKEGGKGAVREVCELLYLSKCKKK